MNLKTLSMMGALLLLAGTGANAQKKKEVLNDSNTPLHLLQPAYKVPYGMLTTEEIKADMDRVLRYLEKVSIRPRACFSPSYNKVKSQTKHVWLLTLL